MIAPPGDKDETTSESLSNKKTHPGGFEESDIGFVENKNKNKIRSPYIKKIKIDELSNTILFIAVFIGIWQLAYLSGIWPKVSLPSPLLVLESFVEMIQDNTLLVSIGMTLYRLLIGFAASIAVGVGIGLAMVKFTGFGKTMSSFAIGLQSFPSVAWVPFAILLIGLNDVGILFVVIMSSVFSVMMSAYSGIRNIPPIYLKAARNMGAKGFSLFRHLMIPAATPALIIGIKQAWSFAWHALVGAEILMAASIGIGHIMLIGREFQLMDQIIASMIIIFALGMIFDKIIFAKLEDKVREKWGLRQEQDLENK
ncbi:MAG TPA: ABC transporter permease [Candidatus Nitrosocosmicus sp.]|nr:ABC transporter permease [Candidatus Nitrosocosmicus sp.]